jgi:hypothetical protein
MLSRRQRGGLALALLASTALTGPAFALDPSGSAAKVTRITNAAGPGGDRLLETEGPVYMGDEISTNSNGLAQIRFVDNTRIAVGPNSRLVIDSFVFNPDNTARDVTVTAAKGFFRFITGNSPSSAYSIRTPTMTIGIRGTGLDIHSGSSGAEVIFHEGSGFGRYLGQTTEFLSGQCTVYISPFNGGFQTANGLERQRQIAVNFPFVNSQFSNLLLDDLRLNSNSCPTPDPRVFGNPPETLDHLLNQPYR